MNWTRHGEMGMICPPYFVGKFYVEGCTLYSLHFNNERLGWFDSFEDCQIAAERHAETNK